MHDFGIRECPREMLKSFPSFLSTAIAVFGIFWKSDFCEIYIRASRPPIHFREDSDCGGCRNIREPLSFHAVCSRKAK
jgi:hypothetical protein